MQPTNNPINRNVITNTPTTIEEIEGKLKDAIDTNATDNPHMAIDPEKGKMAVVGDANALEKPDYKYDIEYEYTADMLSAEDKNNLRYEEDVDRYYLTLHYEGKRVKPIYRTKVVMLLTNILADAFVVDATGYTSDQIDGQVVQKITDKHLDDVLELAHIVLGVDKEQLEYMTFFSVLDFFTRLLKNEPNIIGECVNFLLRSQKQQTAKK